MELNKKKIDPKTVKFGAGSLKTSFWAICNQKTPEAIRPEPYFQFSQPRTHFNQDFKTNPINLLKAKIHLHLGT